MTKINIKDIHIGILIQNCVAEQNIKLSRICNFLKCSENDIKEMYKSKSLDAEILLRWSKLLEYDFFRIYSQHLILYAPTTHAKKKKEARKSALPQFRKNIYTKAVIDFVLEQIFTNEKTKIQVIEQYGIPKTTLYKWIEKYKP